MGNTASITHQQEIQQQQSPSSMLDDQQLERVSEMLKRSLLGDAITIPNGMSPREYFALSSKNTKSSANLNSGVFFNSKINKTDLKPMRGYASCNELSKAGEKYAETPTSSEGSTTSVESLSKEDAPITAIKRSKNSMSTPAISKNNSLLIPKKLNPIKIPNSSSSTSNTVVPFIKVESPDIVITNSTPKEPSVL